MGSWPPQGAGLYIFVSGVFLLLAVIAVALLAGIYVELRRTGMDKPMSREELEDRINYIETLIDEIQCSWLILDFKAEHKLVCQRCGQSDPVRTGISLNYWVNLARAFRLTHALCEEEHAGHQKPLENDPG